LKDERLPLFRMGEPVHMSRMYYARRLELLAWMHQRGMPVFAIQEEAINTVVDAAVHAQQFTPIED